jgi:hypothetical protein
MSDTITYGGIKFFRHTETYEIRKNQTGTIQYYTRIDTGESGMSLRGLANACGVADNSLRVLFTETTILEEVRNKQGNFDSNQLNQNQNEVRNKSYIYLIEEGDLHVIHDIYCERVIFYYAFESRYKKTKAKELYQALAQHGLRTFIQGKTGYQPAQAPQHDNSLELSIEEQLKRKVEDLELQLIAQNTTIQDQQTNIKQLARKVEDLQYTPHLEKTYQAYLHGMLGGTRELHVSGPYSGRVDIATDRLIVEIKRADDFEKAFGQLLRYRVQLKDTEHANKTYTIFLFGNVTEPERGVLEAMAKATNFQLMIHKDLNDYVDEDELTIREKIRIVS